MKRIKVSCKDSLCFSIFVVNLPEVEDISPPDSPKKTEPVVAQPVKPQPAVAAQPVKPQPAVVQPVTAGPSPIPNLFGFTSTAATTAQPAASTGLFGTGWIL